MILPADPISVLNELTGLSIPALVTLQVIFPFRPTAVTKDRSVRSLNLDSGLIFMSRRIQNFDDNPKVTGSLGQVAAAAYPIGFGICLALLSSFFHHLSATITNPSRSSSSHCLCAVFLSVDQGLAMDSRSADIFLPGNGLNSENNHSLTDSEHYPEFANGFDSFGSAFASSEDDAFNHASVLSIDDLAGDLEFSSVPDGGSFHPDFDLRLTVSVGDESPNHSDDSNSSDPVLKYISQMLMEENMEDESWVFPSDFALQDTEKSFSDVLEEQSDVFRQQTPEFDVNQLIESPPSSIFSENSSFQNTVGTTFNANSNSSNSTDAHWLHDRGKNDHTSPQDVIHLNEVSQLSSDSNSQIYSKAISNSFSHHGDGVMDSATLIKNMFSDAASVLQFNKGMEEARKFLPDSSSLLKNFGNISNSESKMGNLKVSDSIVKNEGEELLGGGSRGRKNHERVEELDVGEGRASKQSASNADEAEFAEWFDKVLLMKGTGGSQCFSDGCQESAAANKPQPSGSSVGRGRSRRQGNNSSVDLRSLLVLCAQAVSTYDLRTANELLKQIRQNSSPNGDGSQRLAHYFANGLEARLAGSQSGAQNFFASIASKKVSIAKMLRAYQLHLCCCPFKKFGIIYANYLIYKLAEKAKVLHIIDFGIGFGFQWPILIQKLGERHKEGHLPLVKLRITGIEFPQPGFRPTERIEETARRLASYCERFNVPFEYKVIPSRNWETVRVEDLKVERNEMVAVNAFGRFNNLLDDTVEGDSPRDAVLSLIRSIKPDVFLHFISNGSYNAPFFVTRFKEALFHLSSMYDMLDATIQDPSKDESRLVLEGDFYGREIMNVVSCEGAERVERPETYKQWQARHVRAGFKQLPLCEEIMEKLRWKLKEYYHKDFVVDEDGKWMLLGWKGRIMYGMSCWVPV